MRWSLIETTVRIPRECGGSTPRGPPHPATGAGDDGHRRRVARVGSITPVTTPPHAASTAPGEDPGADDAAAEIADAAGATAPGDEPRMRVPPWVQLVGLPLTIAFAFFFVRAASHASVVFLVAGLISLLLAPIVRTLTTSGLPRVVSVLMVFGAFAAVVTVLTVGAVDFVVSQSSDVGERSQQIGDVAVTRLDDLQAFTDHRGWNVDVRDQGVRFVDQLEERSTEVSRKAFEYGREFVTIVAEAAFNLVLVIVITIYMLLDAPRISRFAASLFPPTSGMDQLFARMERSLFRYAIGQTLASLVMGVSAAVALWLFGVTGLWDAGDDYAILFGVIVAITEFAPSIGPVVGAVPPILAALFDGPGAMIAVAVLFVILHQVEGHIVIPKLMGAAIAVHPLLVIFGILAGAQLMGVGGVLLALPVLAVLREIVLFARERVAFASWSQPLPAAAFGSAVDAASALADGTLTGEDSPTDAAGAAPGWRGATAAASRWARSRQWPLRSRRRDPEAARPEQHDQGDDQSRDLSDRTDGSDDVHDVRDVRDGEDGSTAGQDDAG